MDDDSVGCAAVFPVPVVTMKLPPASPVFTADHTAIADALAAAATVPDAGISIVSDSFHVLQTPETFGNCYSVVSVSLLWLVRFLQETRMFILCWVLGHFEDSGNERPVKTAIRPAVALRKSTLHSMYSPKLCETNVTSNGLMIPEKKVHHQVDINPIK